MVRTIRLEQVASKMALVEGVLVWKERPLDTATTAAWNKRCAGKAVSLISVKGYPFVRVDNRLYAAHRVVWVLAHGSAPAQEIDHKNGDRRDFCVDNLRDVSRVVNSRNKGMHRNNKSGANGVRRASSGKWHAYIRVYDKQINLGRFPKKQDAIAARVAANAQYGFSSRHGGPHG